MKINYRQLGQNLLGIDKYTKLYLKNALKPYDLKVAEGLVLLALYGNEESTEEEILGNIHKEGVGQTQEKIIDQVHYDKGVMTRTMQNLETNGYVLRKENTTDGRSYIFSLTEKGADFIPTMFSILRFWSQDMFKGIDENEMVVLEKALNIMIENAKNLEYID